MQGTQVELEQAILGTPIKEPSSVISPWVCGRNPCAPLDNAIRTSGSLHSLIAKTVTQG